MTITISALPPELLTALNSLSPEEAQALIGDAPSPEVLLQRLKGLQLQAPEPQAADPVAAAQPAAVNATPKPDADPDDSAAGA